MLKLLQKYKMYILVVVGIFVIVSFLLADAIRQITQFSYERGTVFTVDGRKVSRADLQAAAIHLDGLKRATGQEVHKLFRMDDGPNQWALAAIAAEKAGVVGGPADGRAFARNIVLQRIANEAYRANNPDWRTYLRQTSGLADEQIDQRIDQLTENILASAGRTGNAASEGANAFAEFHGLDRLLRSYRDVPQTSEARLASEARRLLDVATFKYVYVPLTEARIAAAPAPGAEEMQAQFDKFKDTPVGAGEHGFGYRQNDRVTYTWFSIDRAAVSRAVRVDPIEVSKRVLERTKGDKVDPALRPQIESEIRGELTTRAVDDLVSILRAEFLKQSALLPDKDGYKVLPPDWKKPDLTAIVAGAVQRLAAERKVVIAVPEIHTVAAPQDAEAFVKEKGVGAAMLRSGQQTTLLRDVVFAAKEFGKPAGRIPAQAGVPVPTPFTGPDTNLYFVELDTATPAASPKSLDEARPQVEADLRKLKAAAQLKDDLEARLAPIVQFGMTQAPEQLSAMGYPGLTVSDALAQRLSAERGAGIATSDGKAAPPEVQDKSLVEALLSRAEKLDPTMRVDNDSAAERTFVHALAGVTGGVVLAQVTGLKPVTLETFRQLVGEPQFRALVESTEIDRDNSKTLPLPFSTETLIKRFGVTGLEPGKKGD
ncbi:MAG: hypothetical protein K2X91_08690, partial [Thermoleophilia bacterium]|nr:hypothetical protein [Thermoleophilia bacterium]